MSIKLEDIAKETGFSISTVSRVLSNSTYPVSEQIREKVIQVAEMMGYEPNIAARSLRTDRTNTIGIIVDDFLSPFTPVPDDYYGASLATEHLIHLGHRRIGYINGPENWHTCRARLSGYRETLASHNLLFEPSLVQPGDWEIESGYAAAKNFLHLAERPTAIFAANDLMALGAIYAIQDAGLSVPEDVAVVGYDNRNFTKTVRPRITTVSMPVIEMGGVAAELLLNQIAEGRKEEEEIKVKGQLIIRETCGTPEASRTQQEPDSRTLFRRVLFNKQPED